MKDKRGATDFPVVCVGGSAGGLDAYTRLLQQLPDDMGVAIDYVLSPENIAKTLIRISKQEAERT